MVNDFGGDASQTLTAPPKHGLTKCVKMATINLMFYTSASWLDENNLRKEICHR